MSRFPVRFESLLQRGNCPINPRSEMSLSGQIGKRISCLAVNPPPLFSIMEGGKTPSSDGCVGRCGCQDRRLRRRGKPRRSEGAHTWKEELRSESRGGLDAPIAPPARAGQNVGSDRFVQRVVSAQGRTRHPEPRLQPNSGAVGSAVPTRGIDSAHSSAEM